MVLVAGGNTLSENSTFAQSRARIEGARQEMVKKARQNKNNITAGGTCNFECMYQKNTAYHRYGHTKAPYINILCLSTRRRLDSSIHLF